MPCYKIKCNVATVYKGYQIKIKKDISTMVLALGNERLLFSSLSTSDTSCTTRI